VAAVALNVMFSVAVALGRIKRDAASFATLPMWLYRYFNILV
jgi:hypothetical protein